VLRDQVRPADARRHRHPLREALPAVEAAAGEAPPDAGRAPEVELVDELVRGLLDGVEAVSASSWTPSASPPKNW